MQNCLCRWEKFWARDQEIRTGSNDKKFRTDNQIPYGLRRNLDLFFSGILGNEKKILGNEKKSVSFLAKKN